MFELVKINVFDPIIVWQNLSFPSAIFFSLSVVKFKYETGKVKSTEELTEKTSKSPFKYLLLNLVFKVELSYRLLKPTSKHFVELFSNSLKLSCFSDIKELSKSVFIKLFSDFLSLIKEYFAESRLDWNRTIICYRKNRVSFV